LIRIIQKLSLIVRQTPAAIVPMLLVVFIIVAAFIYFLNGGAIGNNTFEGIVVASVLLSLIIFLAIISYTHRVEVPQWFAALAQASELSRDSGPFTYDRQCTLVLTSGKRQYTVRHTPGDEGKSDGAIFFGRKYKYALLRDVSIATPLAFKPSFVLLMREYADYREAKYPDPKVRFRHRFGFEGIDTETKDELFADPDLRYLFSSFQATTDFVICIEGEQLVLYKIFNRESVKSTIEIFDMLDQLSSRIEALA